MFTIKDFERWERLIKIRFKSVIGNSIETLEGSSVLNGYFVSSKTGGNVDRGWCKLFAPHMIEVVSD